LVLFGGSDKLVHPQVVHASFHAHTYACDQLPADNPPRTSIFFARDSASSRPVHVRRFHAEPRVGVLVNDAAVAGWSSFNGLAVCKSPLGRFKDSSFLRIVPNGKFF